MTEREPLLCCVCEKEGHFVNAKVKLGGFAYCIKHKPK